MNPRLRLAAIGAPALFIALVVTLFFVDRASHDGLVPRAVTAAGIELGGLSPDEAIARLAALEAQLASLPIRVHVEEASADLFPRDLGLFLDKRAMVDEAMMLGRKGGIVDSFRRWVGTLGSSDELPLRATFDEFELSEALDNLAQTLVGEAPFPGSISIVDGQLVAEYPRPGLAIDPVTATPRLLEAFVLDPHPSVELDLVPAQPRLTAAHIDAALREAERLLDGDVLLHPPDGTEPLVFTVEDLQRAFRADVVRDGDAHRMVVDFDEAVLVGKVTPITHELSTEPVDAEFIFDEETHLATIVPSVPGTTIDFDGLTDAVMEAAISADREADLPVIEGIEAEVTTKMLEELGIKHMVSSFTTYHQCCQARVVNIQLMADTVNGTLVPPGEEFSLNAVVGERTTAGGYLPAGTIVAGEMEDTIGGGVSQFSTTLYNAVFWGGLEDVTHTPHSLYFSRYPEGIEATINWPDVHNKFRNDTDKTIMVRTRYTDTSITVEIWGDNDGRILWGDQWKGITTIDVLAEGGPDSRGVSAEVSERYGHTDPKPQYEADDTIKPGIQVIDDDGGAGWSVKVTRLIEYRGQASIREWVVRYSSSPIITLVHPCMISGSGLVPDWEAVCPPNQPPVVSSISGPTTATVGESINVAVSASDDWDKTLAYSWSCPGANCASPSAASTSVAFGAAGEYTLTVTVTDADGSAGQGSITVSVSNP